MTSVELRSDRAKLIADARVILNKAETEKRSCTAEEKEQWDKLMKEGDILLERAERLERQEKEERALKESAGKKTQSETPSNGTGIIPVADRRKSDEYRSMFNSYLKEGFRGFGPNEYRALQADADVQGGFLVAPEQFVDNLIRFVNNFVFVRQFATKYTVTEAATMGVPSLDADPSDPVWTAELTTAPQDSAMAFGKREFKPHPITKTLKISRKLMRLMPGVDNLVLERIAYKFGVAMEQAYLTGDGVQKPLGLFTASSSGISTARDVSTGNTTTAISADGLIEAKYSLKAQYQQSKTTGWLFSRTAIKNIRKLKDGNGQYLWAPGLASSEPDRILEVPFYMSEYVPSTFTTGLYVGLIGDLKFYWIADVAQMTMQRLEELYAETNQIGYIGRWETDGMPVLEEAFARVKLA